eukprot:NODE_3962_length_888_cov_28.418355_g3650_i0.p1 GENE.NODE_3962_length_888_cov_28.418355_g3650_i0~~NODE_3962_length_888_cov_28.418355_g3650_i0.p1  ORF type:complete len:213 (+),score=35.56 NODE_3962_length_888_cov_28.418355_g3650_i0:195-833(+)
MRQRIASIVPSGRDVLETAAGIGSNLPFYPAGTRLVMCDLSDGMLKLLRDRVEELGTHEGGSPLARCSVEHADSQDLPYPRHSFDFVVDTFGLCSVSEPQNALREMFRVLRPEGRLVLIEHCSSSWGIVRAHQSLTASHRLRDWGCFQTRSISDFVEAAQFEVEEMERFGFGSTLYIVARRPPHIADHFPEESKYAREGWKQWLLSRFVGGK